MDEDSGVSMQWDDGALVVVDQRRLPHEYVLLRLATVDEVIEAISTLAVRGAPAIGVSGGFGVAMSALANADVASDAARIVAARPTAVNLAWAVNRALSKVCDGAESVLAEAQAMLAEDGETNLRAATHAADLVEQLCSNGGLRVLTHCNTGGLATTSVGTALGAIRVLHERGRIEEVLVGETRPLLQGARLTTWELDQLRIPYRLLVDSAAAWAMQTEGVDCVIVGADRIAANGAVANKIGTYGLALSARRHSIPFVVVAPESTRDRSTPSGNQIVVEQRQPEEVTGFSGVIAAPIGAGVFNPAFDVTPPELVTAIVTEEGSEAYFTGRRNAQTAAMQIVSITHELYDRGWMPGTAGNVSVRSDNETLMITGSGLSKGEITSNDVVTVTLDGQLVSGVLRPSAETVIHAAIYQATDAQAVVHIHPPYATALSLAETGLRLSDYELIKGLTAAPIAEIPVFVNHVDVSQIAADVEAYLRAHVDPVPALMIAGHGVTAWGQDLSQARDRVECVEALCQQEMLAAR